MPVASPNWLAMIAASVSPGPKMFALMCCELPISNATAMVSPMARPSPMITAETSPPRLCGMIDPLIISHRVAPIP